MYKGKSIRRNRKFHRPPKKDPNEKQARLDARSSLLSSCQIYCLVITYTIAMAISMLLTTLAPDMLIYDEGNVYSCPVDHMDNELASLYENELNDDEGKAY